MLSLNFNLTACSTVAFTDLLEQINHLRLADLSLEHAPLSIGENNLLQFRGLVGFDHLDVGEAGSCFVTQ